MKPLATLIGAALVGVFALFAAPAAQAQVGVNINIGAPAWGPQAPYGTQYYYIPEIDGYYDLYNQQYIVYQEGYWAPLAQLYGYDPYQFHPVVIGYRGNQPWLQSSYYHQRYAYQPYRNYGPNRAAYYTSGHGYGGSHGRSRIVYSSGRGYHNHDHDHDDRGSYRGNDNRGGHNPNGSGYSTPRSDQQPQQGGSGYNQGQGQSHHGGGNRGGGRGRG